MKVCSLEERVTYYLGRDPACQIYIPDPSISRRHALLESEGDGWTLRDLSSKNGTTVNGEPIESIPLDGDRWLAFGDLQARFQILGQKLVEQEAGKNSERWRHCTILGEQLNNERDLRRLLTRTLEGVVKLASTDRAFILLKDGAGDLVVSAVLGVTPDALHHADFAGSRSAVAEVSESGQPLVTCDSLCHQFLAQQPSIQLNAIRALACLPLTFDGKRLGVLYTDSLVLGKAITELDLRILEAMADNAAIAIAASILSADLNELSQCASAPTLPSLSAW